MTQEKKVKAYDEALSRAKNLHKDAIDMGENIRAKQCEIIFPELKESEDERIRKEIIQFIKKRDRSGCDYDYDQWITWLEEHSESRNIDSDDLATLENNENSNIIGSRAMLNACINVLRNVGHSHLSDWLKNQGSKELQVYETKNGEVITYSESEGYKVTEPRFHKGNWIIDKQGLTHQTSAWSEEDEKKISDIFAILRGGENCYYNSPILIDWLKSLKERIGEE